MTIPNEVLAFARSIDALMSDAAGLADMLTAQSEQASGAEAIGMAALATELEQLSKVYRNYMPKIYKHVGEIDTSIFDTFIAAEALEGEEPSDTRARLYAELEVLQNRSLSGPISDADDARKSHLTSNLKLGG